jgi:putative oxidoreductase
MNLANDRVGKLVLRVVLGVVILFHGVGKLKGGVGPIEGMLVAQGLPGVVAYGVYVGEVLAPILVILGLYARIGGLLIAINMLFALWLAHSAEVFALNAQGNWAIEFQALLLAAGLAVMFLGPGKPAFNDK